MQETGTGNFSTLWYFGIKDHSGIRVFLLFELRKGDFKQQEQDSEYSWHWCNSSFKGKSVRDNQG